MVSAVDAPEIAILLVEDADDDVALIIRELGRSSLRCAIHHAATVDAAAAAISAQPPALVLSDFRLPPNDGFDLLRAVQALDPELPVVFVSGAVGEDVAAELMRCGARDVVSKRNLARLPLTVQRVLDEAATRREHHRAQQALRESEARIRALLTTLPVGVFRVGPDGRIESANPFLCMMVGASDESEMLGRHWRDFVVEQPREDLPPGGLGADVVELELAIRRLDQTEFWGHARVRVSPGRDGAPHVDGTLADETARHSVQDALRRGKEEWERTFDAVHELIMLTDPVHVVERVNRAVAQRLGCHPREIVGQTWAEIVAQRLPPVDLRQLIEAVRSGKPVEFDVASEQLGGDFRFSATPRVDHAGAIIGMILVGRDVTTQRQVAELLQRQAVVDQAEHIFRIFRHEAGNALNTLKTTLSVFRQGFVSFDDAKRETYFGRCFESLRIAEQLLAALRSYQTLDRVTLSEVDVAALLESRADMLFATARERGVTCELHCPDAPQVIAADADALVRVLLNVVDNALAATQDRDAPRIDIDLHLASAHTTISITDNGAGIPSDVLPRIFQPLFTTRAEGTGMGLAIVQKLMLRMNGVAEVRSVVDQGTVVELRFPAAGPAS